MTCMETVRWMLIGERERSLWLLFPKSYPAYKPSGIKWLGDVPAHWEVLPNRAIFEEVIKRNCPEEQMLSVTITNGVIRQQELLENTSKKDGSRLDRVFLQTRRAWRHRIQQNAGMARGSWYVRVQRYHQSSVCSATTAAWYQLSLSPSFTENASFLKGSGAVVLRHHFGYVEPSARAFQNDLHVCSTPRRASRHCPLP